MPVLKYEDLTHAELKALPRDRTVVFIPSGPLEQHGLHLPLGTDAFMAEYFSESVVHRLAAKRPDWTFLMMPTLFAGSDTLTYTGSIEVRPEALRAVLYDCCKQLAKDGFRTQIAVSAHGGPRHMVVLEEIAAKMKWRHRTRMISAASRVIFEILSGNFAAKIAAQVEKSGGKMSDEAKEALKCDYHGGLIETSIMMVVKPDLVKPIYKELKPAILSHYWKIKRTSGRSCGEGHGHLGSPALASPEIGAAVIEVILTDLEPLLENFLDGENVSRYFRSPFYYVPFFRTDFKLVAFLVSALAVFGVGLIYANRFLTEMFK
jgi:creatinine amidohydrolase